MPTLDELMRSQSVPGPEMAAPGVNPELEQMLGRISQLQATKGPGGGMPPVSGGPAAGLPMAARGAVQGPMGAPPAPSQIAPEQSNLTFQMLIKAGVPPEIAKQAIAQPKFLQEILLEIQKQQLGAQQKAAAGAPANPAAGG